MKNFAIFFIPESNVCVKVIVKKMILFFFRTYSLPQCSIFVHNNHCLKIGKMSYPL